MCLQLRCLLSQSLGLQRMLDARILSTCVQVASQVVATEVASAPRPLILHGPQLLPLKPCLSIAPARSAQVASPCVPLSESLLGLQVRRPLPQPLGLERPLDARVASRTCASHSDRVRIRVGRSPTASVAARSTLRARVRLLLARVRVKAARTTTDSSSRVRLRTSTSASSGPQGSDFRCHRSSSSSRGCDLLGGPCYCELGGRQLLRPYRCSRALRRLLLAKLRCEQVCSLRLALEVKDRLEEEEEEWRDMATDWDG
jgi:hypothetical protein